MSRRWDRRLSRSLNQLLKLSEAPTGEGFQFRAVLELLITVVIGLVAILLYSSNVKDAPQALSVGIMLASAAALSGGLIGFVFAIPRLRDDTSNESLYMANTNLVEVSDWLTKILVGVTLVQFRQILTEIQHFVAYVQPAFGNGSAAGPFTIALLLYFGIGGFIVSYMATEIFAPSLLTSATQQSRADQLAYKLTTDQLTGKPSAPPERVKSAVAAASPEAQMRVFLATQSHNMAGRAAPDVIKPIAEGLMEGLNPGQPE